MHFIMNGNINFMNDEYIQILTVPNSRPTCHPGTPPGGTLCAGSN